MEDGRKLHKSSRFIQTPDLRRLDTNTKKLPLDLYRLYNAVQEEGGGSLCISNTKWRKVATHMELPIQTYNVLKKMFERFLMEFEKAEVRNLPVT